MADDVRCGRTAPAGGPEARAALRDRLETLTSRVPRVRSLLRSEDEARNRRRGLLTFELVARPLPAAQLRDRAKPYETDRGHPYSFGGQHVVEDWESLTFSELWEAFLEDRPNSLTLIFGARNIGPVRSLLVNIDCGTDRAKLKDTRVGMLQFWVGQEVDPKVILPVVDRLGLTEYADPESLSPRRPGHPDLSIVVDVVRSPLIPDLPRRLAEGVDRLVAEGGGAFEPPTLRFNTSVSRYPSLRERLNAVTADWDAMVFARYRKGFDPFTCPPDHPPARSTASMSRRTRRATWRTGNTSSSGSMWSTPTGRVFWSFTPSRAWRRSSATPTSPT